MKTLQFAYLNDLINNLIPKHNELGIEGTFRVITESDGTFILVDLKYGLTERTLDELISLFNPKKYITKFLQNVMLDVRIKEAKDEVLDKDIKLSGIDTVKNRTNAYYKLMKQKDKIDEEILKELKLVYLVDTPTNIVSTMLGFSLARVNNLTIEKLISFVDNINTMNLNCKLINGVVMIGE